MLGGSAIAHRRGLAMLAGILVLAGFVAFFVPSIGPAAWPDLGPDDDGGPELFSTDDGDDPVGDGDVGPRDGPPDGDDGSEGIRFDGTSGDGSDGASEDGGSGSSGDSGSSTGSDDASGASDGSDGTSDDDTSEDGSEDADETSGDDPSEDGADDGSGDGDGTDSGGDETGGSDDGSDGDGDDPLLRLSAYVRVHARASASS